MTNLKAIGVDGPTEKFGVRPSSGGKGRNRGGASGRRHLEGQEVEHHRAQQQQCRGIDQIEEELAFDVWKDGTHGEENPDGQTSDRP